MIPVEQRWPKMHSPVDPHRHLPELQLSERGGLSSTQLLHRPPAVPHALTELPVTHRPDIGSQHPAQVFMSQTQLPAMQMSPLGHAAPSLAQMHSPLPEQVSVCVVLQVWH
jgi:hypothetical protein